ncbi:MFS transporter [Ilumatobacter sp.]|uniref:MFS transporter n=1 Tax=Ilumatobacter sp. TaxID=1967498 RepID=UPI003C599F1E
MATSTAIFTATPFLLRPIADEFGVSLGAAGWVSTAQLAGFVLGSWTAGRHLRPVRWVFVALCVLGLVANLAAAVAPDLTLLGVARFGSGISLGLAAWFAWQDAFGDADKTSDVAVIGPLVGIGFPPALTILIEVIGLRWMFVILAVIAVSPVIFAGQVDVKDRLRPHRTRHAATRASIVMLFALGLVTLGGSSVYVYAAAIGTDFNGLSPFAVSLAFSANALVAVPAARWTGSRGPAGVWYFATAVMAVLLPSVHATPVFLFAVIGWGFVFFMGMPAAFGLLASKSRFPEERAGDAQAVMALGRVFGPLLGGAFITADRLVAMGLTAAVILCIAGSLMIYIDRARFTRP